MVSYFSNAFFLFLLLQGSSSFRHQMMAARKKCCQRDRRCIFYEQGFFCPSGLTPLKRHQEWRVRAGIGVEKGVLQEEDHQCHFLSFIGLQRRQLEAFSLKYSFLSLSLWWWEDLTLLAVFGARF